MYLRVACIMEYVIREVKYNNIDFKNLCKKLDDFQNEVFP